MPSSNTITTSDLNVFTSSTLIRSAQVNTNFNLWRGHIIPVDPNTVAAAATHTYDLGKSDSAWRNVYSGINVFVEQSTPSANPTASQYQLYFKSDGNLYKKNSSGTETEIGSSVAVVTTNVTTVSAAYSVTSNDDVVLCSGGSFTVTVGPASGRTRPLLIKKTDASLANMIFIDGSTTETIDGTTSVTLCTQGESWNIIPNTTTGYVSLQHNIPCVYTSVGVIGITSTGATAPGKGTSPEYDNYSWWREGIFACITYRLAIGTLQSAGSGDYLMPIPVGMSANTSIVIPTTGAITLSTNATVHASAALPQAYGTYARSDGSGQFTGAYLYNSNYFRLGVQINGGTQMAFWGASSGTPFNNNDMNLQVTVKVPIANWMG